MSPLDEQHWNPLPATGVPPGVTPEQRELLLFDALRAGLGWASSMVPSESRFSSRCGPLD